MFARNIPSITNKSRLIHDVWEFRTYNIDLDNVAAESQAARIMVFCVRALDFSHVCFLLSGRPTTFTPTIDHSRNDKRLQI